MHYLYPSWWRQQKEIFAGLLCEGPVTQSFDVFFDVRLNKRMNKQSKRR